MNVISTHRNNEPDIIKFSSRERALEYISDENDRLLKEIKAGWKIQYLVESLFLYKGDELVYKLELDEYAN